MDTCGPAHCEILWHSIDLLLGNLLWDHDSLPQQSCAPAQVNNPAALSRQRTVNTVFSLNSENLPFPSLEGTQYSLAKRNQLLKIRGDILKS